MELQQKTKTDNNGLIPPYGGELKNLIIKDKNLKNDLISKATYEFECSERNACDVELLMVGAFSPLEGFMDEHNYNSVIKNNRNTNGVLFGLPIVFDSNNEKVKAGETILLTYKKQKIAVLEVSSKWEPDKSLEAELCYGTNSLDHPAVKMIFNDRIVVIFIHKTFQWRKSSNHQKFYIACISLATFKLISSFRDKIIFKVFILDN